MSKTIGQFDYDLFRGSPPEKGDLPHPPVLRLVLKHWDNGGEGSPSVSANLVTEEEIDTQVKS